MRHYLLGFLVVAFLTWSPFTKCRADPPASDSKYLHSFGGGFEYHRDTHKWSILLILNAIRKAPTGGPLYLEATFENPQRQGPQLLVDSSSLKAKDDLISINSPPVSGMVDRKTYEIVVRVYADSAHTVLLGTHKQGMVFHNPGDPEAYAKEMQFRQLTIGRMDIFLLVINQSCHQLNTSCRESHLNCQILKESRPVLVVIGFVVSSNDSHWTHL